ncbi:unnamed protein product [Macrosiphum euphorbiae]|uniref:DUF4806 domain-containing protein n=1 Tax=Macrosiphum euphorbiae TaxID=13131 RepID=A0AAV0XRM0_9HEMI|nr:unnamed protein product [Macrosiphum euphorbiae]
MSAVCGWYVVKFIHEKNTIEVIPNNWMIHFEKCLWPSHIGLLKMQAAIKNRLTPSNDWSSYAIKVICTRMFSNYNEASKFANKTLAETSSESDAPNFLTSSKNRKRTNNTNNNNVLIKKHTLQGNVESSDEEQSNISIDVPPYPKCPNLETIVEEKSNTDKINYCDEDNISNILLVDNNEYNDFEEELNYGSDTQQSLENNLADFEKASNLLVEIPPEVNKEIAIINSSLSTTNNCKFQRQVMRQLVTLNARFEEHTKYLDVIMVMVNDLKEKLQHTNPLETSINGRHEVENVLSKFPVTDEIALNEITNDLNNNSSVYDQIVKTLALIGGSSFKESVRRILRKLITDDYAKSFSYTGHKNNKQPFNKTILASLLTRAVHSSNNNSGRTIKEIESVASIWLTKAGERANKTAVVLNNVNID